MMLVILLVGVIPTFSLYLVLSLSLSLVFMWIQKDKNLSLVVISNYFSIV